MNASQEHPPKWWVVHHPEDKEGDVLLSTARKSRDESIEEACRLVRNVPHEVEDKWEYLEKFGWKCDLIYIGLALEFNTDK